MTTEACRKSGRKHTPIVSRQQQKFFGMVSTGKKKVKGLSVSEAKRHLKESKGKKLPLRHKGTTAYTR